MLWIFSTEISSALVWESWVSLETLKGTVGPTLFLPNNLDLTCPLRLILSEPAVVFRFHVNVSPGSAAARFHISVRMVSLERMDTLKHVLRQCSPTYWTKPPSPFITTNI